ncbi:hypothetical protein SDC9_83950 [bioreactor metagenome]|uniref:Uncharacterized protein n=1 Tax=bioreactor metagenome TaxID=1076179 RepID=A0A644Z8X6_9ZZZZ
MIYGDYPVKNSNYQDPLELNTYTYVPDITAIMQSGNLYIYCMENPIMYIDSEGEVAWFIVMAIGAGVGALVSGGFQVARNFTNGKNWSDGLGKAMLSGAVSGAIATISIPSIGALGSAIITGAVGTLAGRAIVGDIKSIDDVVNALVVGAGAGALGYGASKVLSGLTQKYFAGLTKEGQKLFLSSINKITNRDLTAIRQTISAGGKAAQVDQLIEKYGYDVVIAAFVSGATTEVIPK